MLAMDKRGPVSLIITKFYSIPVSYLSGIVAVVFSVAISDANKTKKVIFKT